MDSPLSAQINIHNFLHPLPPNCWDQQKSTEV